MGNCCKLQRAASWVDDDEWEAAEDNGTAAVEKTERVEVKIRVTRRQLQELLDKAMGRDGKVQQVEKVLEELMSSGRVCYQPPEEMMREHWRPSLYTIPETAEES
ncbi:uncharacterized protein LOC133889997 [Phragmites australis]|uniref:uncharacterized protein LOC133889997 n=1 Tax=Phragmites australis TaxID=29695 RepID=UPI002D79A608|nr:uncharacterized protein LOC133889997 [Phragmites australis]